MKSKRICVWPCLINLGRLKHAFCFLEDFFFFIILYKLCSSYLWKLEYPRTFFHCYKILWIVHGKTSVTTIDILVNFLIIMTCIFQFNTFEDMPDFDLEWQTCHTITYYRPFVEKENILSRRLSHFFDNFLFLMLQLYTLHM